MPFAPLALDGACFAHRFQLALESRDPFLDPTSVDFQLRFTRTARADPARLSRQVVPHACQSRQ